MTEKKTRRAIVLEHGRGMTTRIDVGHVVERTNGEIELYLAPHGSAGQLVVEAAGDDSDKLRDIATRAINLLEARTDASSRRVLAKNLRAELAGVGAETEVVYCGCGLAIYDDAAKKGACLDCERRAKAAR